MNLFSFLFNYFIYLITNNATLLINQFNRFGVLKLRDFKQKKIKKTKEINILINFKDRIFVRL